MDKVAYDKINNFCDAKKETLSQPIRDHMYRKLSTNFFKRVEEKENGNRITALEIVSIRDTLLHDNVLDDLLVTSKLHEKTIKEQYYIEFNKSIEKIHFFRCLGMGILVNLIYSILLLLIFFVAKDYIKNLLSTLINS